MRRPQEQDEIDLKGNFLHFLPMTDTKVGNVYSGKPQPLLFFHTPNPSDDELNIPTKGLIFFCKLSR